MANKHAGVRAALCHDAQSARQGVHDDGVNLLVVRAGGVTLDLAWQLADAFVQAAYRDGWRALSSTSETI